MGGYSMDDLKKDMMGDSQSSPGKAQGAVEAIAMYRKDPRFAREMLSESKKAGNEAMMEGRSRTWLKRLTDMYNIKDPEEAQQLFDKFGGLQGVLDHFQMVTDKEREDNYEKGRQMLDAIRSGMGGTIKDIGDQRRREMDAINNAE